MIVGTSMPAGLDGELGGGGFGGGGVLVLLLLVALTLVVVRTARRTAGRDQGFSGLGAGARVEEWTAKHGWRAHHEDPALPGRWSTAPFGTGADRRATAVVRGTVGGYPATSFTYEWTTEDRPGGDDGRPGAQHHDAHVVALELPTEMRTALPPAAPLSDPQLPGGTYVVDGTSIYTWAPGATEPRAILPTAHRLAELADAALGEASGAGGGTPPAR